MEHTSNENIAAALKLLEEAAIQKKDELRTLLADKYTGLRGLVVETEHKMVQSMTHAKDASVERACTLAKGVDQRVHTNPWPFVAGSVAVGVLLGFILGQSRK